MHGALKAKICSGAADTEDRMVEAESQIRQAAK